MNESVVAAIFGAQETPPWVWDAIGRYQDLVPRNDWPPMDDVFWDVWAHAIQTDAIPADVLDRAMLAVAAAPPDFKTQHLPAIRNRADRIRSGADTPLAFERAAQRHAEIEAEREQAREAAATWDALPEATRAAFLERLGRENPGLARFPKLLRALAIAHLMEGHGIELEAVA